MEKLHLTSPFSLKTIKVTRPLEDNETLITVGNLNSNVINWYLHSIFLYTRFYSPF
jgi:hypothetical protein